MMRPLTILMLTAALLFGSVAAEAATIAETPDETWLIEGPRVQDVIATDDLIFLGGEFTEAIPSVGAVGVPATNLLALDAATGAPAWVQTVASVAGVRTRVWDLDLSADGSVLTVCGQFDSIGGEARGNIAAVDASTGAVLPWAPTMPVCRSLDRRGPIVFAGGGRSIRAIGSDGGTVWAAPTDGPVLTLEANGTALFAGGRFFVVGDSDRPVVARLDAATGVVDTAWTLESVPASDLGEGSFAIDLLVRGSALFVGAGGADHVARFELDTGRLVWWHDTSGSVQSLEVVDDVLVIGGHFRWVADEDTPECGTNQAPVETCTVRLRLAAVDPRTGALDPWGPPVTGAYTGVWALDLDASGHLHLGGAFSSVGGFERHGYARLAVTVPV
jgi:trimeric autotransporter adhesin